LVGTASSSEPETDATAPAGYKEIPWERDHVVTCDLGTVMVRLIISNYGPGQGQGEGAGVLIIEQLEVSGEPVIDPLTNFNWTPGTGRVLSRVTVQAGAGTTGYLELCTSDGWNWSPSYRNVKCERRALPSVKATTAKRPH
jgi:hypothetical protein